METQTIIKKTTGYIGKAADVLTVGGGAVIAAGAIYEGYKTVSGGKLTWTSGLWLATVTLVGIAAVKYGMDEINKWDAVVVTTKVGSEEEADSVVEEIKATVTETSK